MATLFIGLFAGLLGTGYVMYGRRAEKPSALISGFLLCVIPCFLSSVLWVLAIGAAIAAVPFFVDF